MKKFLRAAVFILAALATAVFILSFSIELPIRARSFYYNSIDRYELVEKSGESRENIIAAYDEVMDSLTKGTPFGTGVFTCSDEAKAHFEDCAVLFAVDLAAMIISAVLLSGYAVLRVTGKVKPYKISPVIIGAAAAVLPIVFFGVFLATDQNAAYTFFHTLLFPGKQNWIFDYYKDSIIRILPMRYFIECGVIIGVSDVLLSAVFIATGTVFTVKMRKKGLKTAKNA